MGHCNLGKSVLLSLTAAAWVRVHLSLVGQCNLGYRTPLAQLYGGTCSLGQSVPLGWTVGWYTVAWVRVSPLDGLLQPGLEYTS